MGVEIFGLAFDALDPEAQARFWAGVLERDIDENGVKLLPRDDREFPIYFEKTDVPRPGPNQMHFDLMTSSWDDQKETVERALALGGAHLDVGQLPEELHVVLQDPEGNEFCVIEPINNFLKDTARIGAFSCDGSQAVGYFWSEALGWPLVWDQDEETAIQSPGGGSKISWGGPPLDPKLGQNRIHFDLTSASVQAMAATIARALELGGQHIDIGQTEDDGHVVLADPEGNELCVIEPGNGFLADTGVIGGVNCDGSQALGYFWSAALGWPLVWDQDEETAIQSPAGGSKITWSGPPLMPRLGRDRLRLELAVEDGADVGAEVDRLVSLGASLDASGKSDGIAARLTDPDGNEFHLVTA